MNSEIQQNTSENKKPRMYVSWKRILLTSLGVVFIPYAILWAFLMIPQPSGAITAAFSVVPAISYLIISTALLVIGSFVKRPSGYIRTKIVNLIMFSQPVIVLGVLFLIDPHAVSPYNEYDVSFLDFKNEHFVKLILINLVEFIVLFCGAFLNHKFQKSEFELNEF